MTSQRATHLNILISIVFAAAMIGSSLMIDDKDTSQIVVFILIAIWFVPFTYLTKAQKRE
jgi:hypothetical protein